MEGCQREHERWSLVLRSTHNETKLREVHNSNSSSLFLSTAMQIKDKYYKLLMILCMSPHLKPPSTPTPTPPSSPAHNLPHSILLIRQRRPPPPTLPFPTTAIPIHTFLTPEPSLLPISSLLLLETPKTRRHSRNSRHPRHPRHSKPWHSGWWRRGRKSMRHWHPRNRQWRRHQSRG